MIVSKKRRAPYCPSVHVFIYLQMALFLDDNRMYGYVRITTGDEMSKRAKFALITWIGKDVSTLKKAKVSTDKAFIKSICNVSWLCVFFHHGVAQFLEEMMQSTPSKCLKSLLTTPKGASRWTLGYPCVIWLLSAGCLNLSGSLNPKVLESEIQ